MGGDLSRAPGVVLNMTVFGTVGERVLKRSTARAGQKIYLTGPVGEAALGLYLLKALKRPVHLEEGETLGLDIDWSVVEPLLRRACLPEIRPLEKTSGISASIDLSDGLGIDLWRLCQASAVGARIYWDRLPITDEMKALAEAFALELEGFVLSGGEDYQLLLTGETEDEGLFEVGDVTDSGCEVLMPDGRALPLGPQSGYEHFGHNN